MFVKKIHIKTVHVM